MTVRFRASSLAALLLSLTAALLAQQPPAPEPTVEQMGEGVLRVGRIEVDQNEGRISVGGVINPATVLEYLATARNGFKSYESAVELDASAEEFNLAMILIGLNNESGVPSRHKFDPEPPKGDPVDIWVEWLLPEGPKRVRAEELVYDGSDGETLQTGPWVYTGSVFLEDGSYLATAIGVLMGFMHTPESIIDSPRPLKSSYGAHQLNPHLGLLPGMPVTVVVERCLGNEAP